MSSFHEVQAATYAAARAERLTRIHGKPTWMTKERMKKELAIIAMKHGVSYVWAGENGLIALIIGAARNAADYPTLDPFTEPTQPPNQPDFTGLTTAQIQEARDRNDVLKRDYAVVVGFR